MRGGTRGAVAPVRRPRLRSSLFVACIALNVAANLQRLGVKTGFGFLSGPAGFDISQTLIPFGETATYLTAFVVALAQHAAGHRALDRARRRCSALSSRWRAARRTGSWRRPAALYVETFRNIPLLIQLLFWYFAVMQALPSPRASLQSRRRRFPQQSRAVLFIPWHRRLRRVGFPRSSLEHSAALQTGFNFPRSAAWLISAGTSCRSCTASISRRLTILLCADARPLDLSGLHRRDHARRHAGHLARADRCRLLARPDALADHAPHRRAARAAHHRAAARRLLRHPAQELPRSARRSPIRT